MSIFGNIMSAIFGRGGQYAPGTASAAASASKPTKPQPGSGASNVDVGAVLTGLRRRRKNSIGEDRSSI
jgi:hypothetical protein